MKKILEHSDYRTFLKERFVELKEAKPSFSYQFCAKKINKSTSYLKQIIGRRNHVTLDNIAKIAKVFELNPFEQKYFTMLCIQNQIRDPELQEYFLTILELLKSSHLDYQKYNSRNIGQYDPLLTADWLMGAIAELTKFEDFQEDPNWIRAQLIDGAEISIDQINSTIQTLLTRNTLIRNKNGQLEYIGVDGGDNPYNTDAFQPHQNRLMKTHQVLDNPQKYRSCHFFTATVAVNRDDEAKIMKLFHSFRDESLAIAKSSEKPNRVLSLCSHVFNMVKRTN